MPPKNAKSTSAVASAAASITAPLPEPTKPEKKPLPDLSGLKVNVPPPPPIGIGTAVLESPKVPASGDLDLLKKAIAGKPKPDLSSLLPPKELPWEDSNDSPNQPGQHVPAAQTGSDPRILGELSLLRSSFSDELASLRQTLLEAVADVRNVAQQAVDQSAGNVSRLIGLEEGLSQMSLQMDRLEGALGAHAKLVVQPSAVAQAVLPTTIPLSSKESPAEIMARLGVDSDIFTAMDEIIRSRVGTSADSLVAAMLPSFQTSNPAITHNDLYDLLDSLGNIDLNRNLQSS